MTSTSGRTRTEFQSSRTGSPCKVRLAGASCISAEPSLVDAEPSVEGSEPSIEGIEVPAVDIGHHQHVNAWLSRLENLVEQARVEDGDERVRAALKSLVRKIDREVAAPQSLTPPVAVLGVDGCKAGWVGILIRPTGKTSLHVASTIAGLVEQVREYDVLGVVGVDIPIGLPDRTARRAESLIRAELPGKTSSVFSTAPRAAYEARDYDAARLASVAASDTNTSLSRQAWALAPKILEVDAWVRLRPSVAVIEVHPELSFARMHGAPVLASKKSGEGVIVRRELLARVGITVPPMYSGMGFAEDDLLDACAVAWSAARHAGGVSESFPSPPEVFSDGVEAAIWV